MPLARALENLLFAKRVDVDDGADVAACAAIATLNVATVQAVIDVFRPLSESFELFVTL